MLVIILVSCGNSAVCRIMRKPKALLVLKYLLPSIVDDLNRPSFKGRFLDDAAAADWSVRSSAATTP
jgi:hypothetical protein